MLPGACDHLRDLYLSVSIQLRLEKMHGSCTTAEWKLLCVPCRDSIVPVALAAVFHIFV